MNAEQTTLIGPDRAPALYTRTLWVLGVVAVVGLASWFYLLAQDQGWGTFAVNYLFLTGLAQFGVVFSGIMRLSGAHWPKGYYRIAELTTIASFPFAIIGLIFLYAGRDVLLFWTAPDVNPGYVQPWWMHEGWLLARNLIAQLIFYGLAFVYVFTAMLGDLDADAVSSGPRWRRGLLGWLRSKRRTQDNTARERRLYRMSVAVLMVFALPNTLLAWDYAMMLYPHWHSSVFSMHFMMGSLLSGTAFIVLAHVIVSRFIDTSRFIGGAELKNMGILTLGFVLFWLYLWWSQFFVTWYGNLPDQKAPLDAQMVGHYAPLFWAMMAMVLFIPFATLIFERIKRVPWAMALLALVILTGIWLNRYLTVLPAIADDHWPLATLGELLVTVGWFAAFLFVLLALLSAFPAISRWEVAMSPAEDLHGHGAAGEPGHG